MEEFVPLVKFAVFCGKIVFYDSYHIGDSKLEKNSTGIHSLFNNAQIRLHVDDVFPAFIKKKIHRGLIENAS